jgi:hypothetical protein
MAQQNVAARFHLKVDDEEGSGSGGFENGQWHDIS